MNILDKQKKEGWQILKFEDIAQEIKVNSKNPLEDGFKKYVGLEHIDPGGLTLERFGLIEKDKITFTKTFKKGNILFGRRNPYLKKSVEAPFDGICSGDIIVISAKEDFIIKDLLPFIMQSDKFFDWAIKYSAGSMTPRTKFESLKKLELSIPPKEYQKKILKNLKKIQKLSLETKNIYLDSLNFFQRIIDNFICNDRQPNPKEGWGRFSLKDLVKSNINSLKKDTNSDLKINYIDISSIEYPGNLIKTENFTFKDAPSRARRLLKKNDVIISTVRPNRRATLFINSDELSKNIASTGFCVLTPNKGINGEWIFYSTLSKSFTHSMKNLMVGTSFPAVSPADILSQKIDYHKDPLVLEKYLDKIRSSFKISEKLKEKIINLNTLQRKFFDYYMDF